MSVPVKFYDSAEEALKAHSPVYQLGQGDKREIHITKDDRQYVRGNKLYVEYKGVKLYVDIDSEIFINTMSDEIQVFKHKELAPPEQREYLLLLAVNDNEAEDGVLYQWTGIIGRQQAFDYIANMADDLDWSNSRILAETATMSNMISIYKFMRLCIDNENVENPHGFDPDDFASEDEDNVDNN